MAHEIGDIVEVGLQYVGGGRYAPSGHEGYYRVVGKVGDRDYKLTRDIGDDSGDWDLIVHEQSIVGHPLARRAHVGESCTCAERDYGLCPKCLREGD